MKTTDKEPYQNIIDFIDTAIDSDELMKWLINLEKLPDNLRSDHLAQMKTRMVNNNEPDKIIDIVETVNKREILSAINRVIKDVYDSGLKTKKYLKNNNNADFNVLITLIAAV
jgi:hypothetical protein